MVISAPTMTERATGRTDGPRGPQPRLLRAAGPEIPVSYYERASVSHVLLLDDGDSYGGGYGVRRWLSLRRPTAYRRFTAVDMGPACGGYGLRPWLSRFMAAAMAIADMGTAVATAIADTGMGGGYGLSADTGMAVATAIEAMATRVRATGDGRPATQTVGGLWAWAATAGHGGYGGYGGYGRITAAARRTSRTGWTWTPRHDLLTKAKTRRRGPGAFWISNS